MRVIQKINTFLDDSRYNLIFLISLVMFNILYLLFGFSYHNIFEETDGFSYFLYYKDIINNNIPPFYSEYLPAGLPLLIGGIFTFLGDFFIVGKIIIVEFSILFLISTYLVIKTIFNERVAYFTFIFAASKYYLVYFFYTIYSDLVFSSLFIGFATMIRWTGFLPLLSRV